MYVLVICDGWGIAPPSPGNAIYHANTPNMDKWKEEYPFTTLQACCRHVGLPPAQMGNSEVGHLNIGAGRVVFSPLMRINHSIETGDFMKNRVLLDAMTRARKDKRPIHLLGMVSDGGVHSHLDHLLALIDMTNATGVRPVVHAILDGRDTLPRAAEPFLIQLEEKLQGTAGGRIADISGRYYTMDRDKRWQRTEKAYRCLVRGEGEHASTAIEALRMAYERGEGDEFVLPTIISDDPEKTDPGRFNDPIIDGDQVIFFNFRPDRARQLSHALIDEEFTSFRREDVLVDLTTMMKYEDTLTTPIAFPPIPISNVLGEVLSNNGKRQLRLTETEKFAHVTFFFNGGREEPFAGEDRILIPSPKVATYDLQPEMSAPVITTQFLDVYDEYDVIIMNLANADMVGHTGVFEAAVKAAETVDECLGKIVDAVLEKNGTIFITADHGNAEYSMAEDGSPLTAHSLNPVPFLWISNNSRDYRDRGGKLREGAIPDIAPTLLKLMGITIPPEMTSPSIIPDE